MKIFIRFFYIIVLLPMLMSACGQPGPLYLPRDQPSVYVEPTPVNGGYKPNEANNPNTSGQHPAEQPPKKQ